MKKENLYEDGKIRTYTGKYVDILNPSPGDIDIEDIAHSLSFMPRFGGHTKEFFSVAQHCILCSYWTLDQTNKGMFEALMHDASEAYLMDIPSPVKKLIPDYKKIEDVFMRVISQKFGFNYPLSEATVAVDRFVLEVEWNNLVIMRKNTSPTINPVSKKESKRWFLEIFHNLNEKICKSKSLDSTLGQ